MSGIVFNTPSSQSIFVNGAIPADLKACVTTGQSTPACDLTIGSLSSNGGYCSQSAYSTTTYCACLKKWDYETFCSS